MEKIRVLISDDMKYMRLFFTELVNSSQNCICVGEAESEAETLEQIEKLNPDIILLDVQMDREDSGLILIPKILEMSPEIKIIIVSVHDDNETIFKAIQMGAKDYVLKEQDPKEIIESIERVCRGKNEIGEKIAKKILEQCNEMEKRQKSILYFMNNMMMLSTREIEILRTLLEGRTYAQIAKNMFIEEVTVRTYASRILKKMNYNKMSVLLEDLKEMGVAEFLKMGKY